MLGVHFIVAFAAIIIHQEVPLHYFLPVFPIPIILASMLIVALLLHHLWFSRVLGITAAFAVLIVISANSAYFFSERWFYQPQDRMTPNHPYPFALQERVVKTIFSDAKGQPFNLKRVGSFDYYAYTHAQHYRYLLWKLGNEPADPPQSLTYTVYEDTSKLPIENSHQLLWVSNIAILKNEKKPSAL